MASKREFDVILFDLEGTLVDFQWRMEAAVKEILPVLARTGINLASYGENPDYAGIYNTTRDIVAEWSAEDASLLFEQLTVIYEKYDQDALSMWKPYPDTHDVLEWISACGYRMGVVSNCGFKASTTILEKFNLTEYFKIIISRNDLLYLKPSPEGLKLVLKHLGVSAARTLFVGDSLNDILAADKIDMPSCFLNGGESRVTGQTAFNATFQIKSLSGLSNILAQ